MSHPIHQLMDTANLSLTGLIFLAQLFPLSPLAIRTALNGCPPWTSALLLCPGMQCHTRPTDLNEGEYPACAAMTTGYVFRVENQATVFYLCRAGRTGCLTTLEVQRSPESLLNRRILTDKKRVARAAVDILLFFPTAALFNIYFNVTSSRSALPQDNWLLAVLLVLVGSRFLADRIISRRLANSWHGASEPGVQGDLLVLLSQDRWIRLQGPVDDLKAITSGSRLRDPDPIESAIMFLATLLVYTAAILTVNVGRQGQLALLGVMIYQAVLLALSNSLTEGLSMNGCTVIAKGEPTHYRRRLDMAEELIRETGRDDWAVKLGMVNRQKGDKAPKEDGEGEVVTM